MSRFNQKGIALGAGSAITNAKSNMVHFVWIICVALIFYILAIFIISDIRSENFMDMLWIYMEYLRVSFFEHIGATTYTFNGKNYYPKILVEALSPVSKQFEHFIYISALWALPTWVMTFLSFGYFSKKSKNIMQDEFIAGTQLFNADEFYKKIFNNEKDAFYFDCRDILNERKK